jgi:tetratricopeptide (TPR) repeat protein
MIEPSAVFSTSSSTTNAVSYTTFSIGFSLASASQIAPAKLGYEKVLSINPNHFGAHNLFGALALKMNQYKQAIDAIDKEIAINPQQASAYNNRGIAFKKLNQFKSAVAN